MYSNLNKYDGNIMSNKNEQSSIEVTDVVDRRSPLDIISVNKIIDSNNASPVNTKAYIVLEYLVDILGTMSMFSNMSDFMSSDIETMVMTAHAGPPIGSIACVYDDWTVLTAQISKGLSDDLRKIYTRLISICDKSTVHDVISDCIQANAINLAGVSNSNITDRTTTLLASGDVYIMVLSLIELLTPKQLLSIGVTRKSISEYLKAQANQS